MSWEAQAYVRQLRIAPNGEKLTKMEKYLLMLLAECHNYYKRVSWPSVETMAEDLLMSEREARLLLRSVEGKGVIRTIQPEKNGRGYYRAYVFTEFERERDMQVQRGKGVPPFGTGKGNSVPSSDTGRGNGVPPFCPPGRGQEGGMGRSRNKEEPKPKENPNQKHHAFGALRPEWVDAWLRIKEAMRERLTAEEWERWIRPARLVGMLDPGSRTILIAVPPNGAIMAAAHAGRKLLCEVAKETADYRTVLTRYPDEWEREEVARRYPELIDRQGGHA